MKVWWNFASDRWRAIPISITGGIGEILDLQMERYITGKGTCASHHFGY